jgi:competence protein ComEC
MNLIKQFHALPSLYFFLLIAGGVSTAWLLGDVLNPLYLLIASILLLLFAAINYKKDSRFFISVLILFFLAGTLRAWFALFPFTPQENTLFNPEISAVQGTIEEVKTRPGKADIYLLHCEKIIIKNNGVPTNGLIIVNQGRSPDKFRYGDVIRIKGKPQYPRLPTNPGEFNYQRYLALNNRFFQIRLTKESEVVQIFSRKGNWLQSNVFNKARDFIKNIIDKYLEGQSAAIVKALILGDRGGLDKGVMTDFQKTGVIHVLAISGLHVAYIAMFLQFILSVLRIPKKINMALIVLFLVFFLALVNFKAPVVRASLMMSFYYLAQFSGRPQKSTNIVALAGLVILLVRPEELLLPGFQYSFAAVFGLIYGNAKLSALLPKFYADSLPQRYFNKLVREPFIASFCAILATLPLTWYYFGSFQIGALIANIFVIPIIGIILFLSIFLILVSGLTFLPLSGIAFIITFLIDSMVFLVGAFSKFPLIQIKTAHPAMLYVILISMAVFFIFNLKVLKARLALLAILSFFILNFLVGIIAENKLRITYIHVGQGDATLLEFPNGKNALIDAGNKGFGFDAGERFVNPVLKYYGISRINYLIGSHPHSDHIGGFEYILANYTVDTLVINEFKAKSKIYKRILNTAKDNKVFIKYADEGDIIIPDKRMRIYVLHPDTTFERNDSHAGHTINNSSLVFKILHGKNSFLFTGDAEFESERDMLNYGSFLDSDILKVGHHGSKTSSGDRFIDQVKPEIAVISVGRKNKFKHPAPLTLAKFKNRGIKFYRTDQVGTLVFESDGQKLERINWR